MANSPDELFTTIDWKLLREQKAAILELIADFNDAGLSLEEIPPLEGIVNLIDGIQDCACNCGYGTEAEIFGKPDRGDPASE